MSPDLRSTGQCAITSHHSEPFAGKRYTHPANGRQRCNHRLNFSMRDDYRCVA